MVFHNTHYILTTGGVMLAITLAQILCDGSLGATHEQVVEEAKATYVDRFVRTLPDGYATVLDDEATNLSAGERQLITIAGPSSPVPPCSSWTRRPARSTPGQRYCSSARWRPNRTAPRPWPGQGAVVLTYALQAAGTGGCKLSRPQKLASATCQVPLVSTAWPFWPLITGIPESSSVHVTLAVEPLTVTAVTCAAVSFAWDELASPARTAENFEPFCSRVIFVAVGVAGSKNATQFVATAFAAPVRPAGMFESELEAAADAEPEALAEAEALADEAEALAGAEDVGEAGGAEDVELDELHAESARQPTVAVTARKLTGWMRIRNMP
ncbi:hypothetical protein [Trebonia kvetii]|uniref:hypothetical protein n=1 Tax=Trebonia kvetii TaxID=2480626 RepID=UPI001C9E785A